VLTAFWSISINGLMHSTLSCDLMLPADTVSMEKLAVKAV